MGLRKSNQAKTLMRLYERKKINYSPREVLELSSGELKHKIEELRND